MDVSKFLSKVIGIYFIVVSASMLFNMPQFINNVTKLIYNESLMFTLGFITLIIGILMVVSHNVWELSWKLIITIISWLVFIKGASIILFPAAIDRMSVLFVQNLNMAYGAAGIDLVLGLILVCIGFRCQGNRC